MINVFLLNLGDISAAINNSSFNVGELVGPLLSGVIIIVFI